jgi:hypothetical protein
MCVISINEYARLTDEQVIQMYEANKSGGGVAWRETDAAGRTVVKWKKGLFKEEMLEANRTLPLPYVLHFRVPSPDTSSSLLACHPFQIDSEATVEFEGETDGFVLFHNGHWNGWKDKIQTIALSGYVYVPSGPWSDSRALAWAAHHLGIGFLEMVNEKIVAFGPKDEDIEVFGGWMILENLDENGKKANILVSNKGWERTVTHYPVVQQHVPVINDTRRSNIVALANQNRAGGTDPSGATFRTENALESASTGQEGNQQERVQTAATETRTGAFQSGDFVRCAERSCQKQTRSGNILNEQFYCWHCWADKTKQERGDAIKPFIGTCGTCKVAYAASKVRDTNQWICEACWKTNGRPKVYFVSGRES